MQRGAVQVRGDQTLNPVFVGLDLGMRRDYTAMVCSERRMIEFSGDPPDTAAAPSLKVLPPKSELVIAHGHAPGAKAPPREHVVSQYVCRHVQRFELDVRGGYPEIVARVAALFARKEYAGQWLVVDQTGVGAAVVDMFRKARREPVRCAKCNGTGSVEALPVVGGMLVFHRQNLDATAATIGALQGTKVTHKRDFVDRNGWPGGDNVFQAIEFTGDCRFVEFAVRNQGYARIVNVVPITVPGGPTACLTCGGEGRHVREPGRIMLNARVAAVHITGQNATDGRGWRYDAPTDTWYVGKRELISVLLVLMESNPGRFVIDPRLRYAKELVTELGNFRAKRKPDSRDESLEAWRSSQHDDLVLAAAMSLWFAERASKKPWVRL